MGSERERRSFAANAALTLLVLIAFLAAARCAGYLDNFRYTWLHLAAMVAVSVWSGRHISTSRFARLLLFGLLVGAAAEYLGSSTGCWEYKDGGWRFWVGALEKSLTAVFLYSAVYAVDGLLTRLRLPYIPGWAGTVIVTGAFTVLVLTCAYQLEHVSPSPLFTYYYPAYFLVALCAAGQMRALRVLAVLLVVPLASLAGEYVGGYLDGIWRFPYDPTHPPVFLAFGVWPLEFLTVYALSSLPWKGGAIPREGDGVVLAPWRRGANRDPGETPSWSAIFRAIIAFFTPEPRTPRAQKPLPVRMWRSHLMKMFSSSPGVNEVWCLAFIAAFACVIAYDFRSNPPAVNGAWCLALSLVLALLFLLCLTAASRMQPKRFLVLLLAGAGFHYIFTRAGVSAGYWAFPTDPAAGCAPSYLFALPLGGLMYVAVHVIASVVMRRLAASQASHIPRRPEGQVPQNRFFTAFCILAYLLALTLIGGKLLERTAGVFWAGTGLFLFFLLMKSQAWSRSGAASLSFRITSFLVLAACADFVILGVGLFMHCAGLVRLLPASMPAVPIPEVFLLLMEPATDSYVLVVLFVGVAVTYLVAHFYSAFASGEPMWSHFRRGETVVAGTPPKETPLNQWKKERSDSNPVSVTFACEPGENRKTPLDAQKLENLKALENHPPKESVLVVVRGGDIRACTTKALELLCEHTPSLDEKFQGPYGVFIKPNLVMQFPSPVTTAPELLQQVARYCRDEKGATRVIIGETSLVDVLCQESMIETGLKEYLEEDRIECRLLDEGRFRKIRFADGSLEKGGFDGFLLPGELLLSDVYIDVAKMKTHNLTQVTLGIKNSHGLVLDDEKPWCHGNIQRKTVNITQARMPDITVIDGFDALEGDGPLIGDRVAMRTVIASNDVLAADWLAAKLMEFDPSKVLTVALGAGHGIGRAPDGSSTLPGTPQLIVWDAGSQVVKPSPGALLAEVLSWSRRFRRPYVTFEGLCTGVLGRVPGAHGGPCGEMDENETWEPPAAAVRSIGPLQFAADGIRRDDAMMLAGILPPFKTPLAECMAGEMARMKDVVLVFGELKYPVECAVALLFGDDAIRSEPLVHAGRIVQLPGNPPRSYLAFFDAISNELDMPLVRYFIESVLTDRGDYL